MDYNKIGNFIAKERKNKKLTQVKLAEKLYVSEKTISKWENGNGIPDTNTLPKLCEIFDVSLNELLSGERNVVEKNSNQNEQLLLEMAKDIEVKNKIIWISMWIIMIISIIAMLAGIFLVEFLIPKGFWQGVLFIVIMVVFLIPCFYALKLETSVGSYKCKKCGCEIVPTYKEVVNSMHMGFTRYLKCPQCQKRRWCKKNIKK